jgi:hypothetical protein
MDAPTVPFDRGIAPSDLHIDITLPSPFTDQFVFFSYFSVDYVFNSNIQNSTDIVVYFYFSHSIADHVDKIKYR